MASQRDIRSIAVKLPLTAGLLLLAVTATLVTASYLTMRSNSIHLANDRLSFLAKYFADTYSTTTTNFQNQLKATAGNDSIVDFVTIPSERSRQAALQFLNNHGGGRGGPYAIQIRDTRGRVLLSTGTRAARIDSAVDRNDFPVVRRNDSMAAGPLRVIDDTLVYPLVAAIGTEEPIAQLVQWRQVTTVPRLSALMENLLGSSGAMYFGNADGSLWTDFTSIAKRPVDAPTHLQGNLKYTRAAPRGNVFASVEAIPGTPWIWSAEFPTQSVLSPSNTFLKRMGLVTLFCLIFGIGLAWVLSRRLTAPLGELTVAAHSLAEGNRSLRIQMNRKDELGLLGNAFNLMAEQVAESHQRLEGEVEKRTEALNLALEQLQSAQESLVRREKLAMLGQLASGVGHELRNPLGVMSNAIYYLQMVLPDATPDVKEYLGMLQAQVALSGKIVTDLLDLARVSPVQRVPVTLHRLIESQRERLPEARNVTFDVDLREGLPLANVDPVHAGQVVLNLMLNAVQAMGEGGGTIMVQGRLNDEGQLCLEVRDSGPGVAPEHADKIFEPLYTTKARGIGLGLAVSRSLAQANGGDLQLQTPAGGGAAFLFTMPSAGLAG